MESSDKLEHAHCFRIEFSARNALKRDMVVLIELPYRMHCRYLIQNDEEIMEIQFHYCSLNKLLRVQNDVCWIIQTSVLNNSWI